MTPREIASDIRRRAIVIGLRHDAEATAAAVDLLIETFMRRQEDDLEHSCHGERSLGPNQRPIDLKSNIQVS